MGISLRNPKYGLRLEPKADRFQPGGTVSAKVSIQPSRSVYVSDGQLTLICAETIYYLEDVDIWRQGPSGESTKTNKVTYNRVEQSEASSVQREVSLSSSYVLDVNTLISIVSPPTVAGRVASIT